MNFRRGANTKKNNKQTNVQENVQDNVSPVTPIEEYRHIKTKIRNDLENNIALSEYFEYFDKTQQKMMNSRQNYFLEVAANVALNSVMNHKHGAVIVYKKNIIAVGFNYCNSNSNLSIHAEVAAISQLKGKEKNILSECDLYVVRIAPKKFDNMLKYSKPCINCQNFICKKNIKTTYYSTNYAYDEILSQNQCMPCEIQ